MENPNNPVKPIPVKVIYHANCDDGFGAAWAAHRFYKETNGNNNVEYIPCSYGQIIEEERIKGNRVLIVDFSFPRIVLEGMRKAASSLLILDHHKKAAKDLEGFPDTVFDMNRSGAVITWNYLFPGRPVPQLLNYIQDNDLWKHHLADCQAVIRYIRSFPHDFEIWDFLSFEFETKLKQVIETSLHVERYYQNELAFMKKQGVRIFIPPYEAMIVSTPKIFVSDVCHDLCIEKNLDICLGWFMRTDHKIEVSIRGKKEIDCSAIAEIYGGGGHHGAAGFQMTLQEFTDFFNVHKVE